jgi:glycosyltransferase involved in cell wall biosynthesis
LARILFIGVAPLAVSKGTERFFVDWGNHLKESGHDVFYLSDSGFNQDIPRFPVDIRFKTRQERFVRFGPYYHVPRRVLAEIQPDIVYLSTFTLFPFLPLMRFRFVLGTTTLDSEVVRFMSFPRRLLFRIKSQLLRVLVCFAYSPSRMVVHALNRTQLAWLRKHGFERFRIEVIFCPVNLVNIHPDPELWYASKTFDVTFLGAVAESKGILEFLEVARIASEQGIPDLRFLVAGAGIRSDAVVEQGKKLGNLQYLGVISEGGKANLLNSSQLVLSPSHSENLHYVTVESMVCGCPVVSSDCAGPRELIDPGLSGELVASHDPVDFFAAVEHYYNLWKGDKDSYLAQRRSIAALGASLTRSGRIDTLNALTAFVESLT